jgi:hypothetical protein
MGSDIMFIIGWVGTTILKELTNSIVIAWDISLLTFKNRASYIWDGRIATLQMLHFIYFFNKYKY